MTVWFTSDTHFGHENIIGYSSRPFACIDEMDAALIRNWNDRVAPDDEVWHLGDVAFRNAKATEGYLGQLNGRKHLVWGNHDPSAVRSLPLWESSQPYAEIAVEGRKIVLLHYGLRVWNRAHHGALHFFGHSHGSLPGDRQSCDVGVDNPASGYSPWSLSEIEAHLASLPPRTPVDHHGADR
ncbi:MAG TPA: metallophosphoesterase family protein [Aliidongia sp.]|nr:metallophosphoesterase family protein [Aliidongia sp.]